GASCTQCHTSIVEGNGDVPDESCTSCHSEPETVRRYGEVDLIHKDHLSYGVECSRCHLDIKHELPSPHKPPTAACNSCHAGSHLGQAATLKGRMLQLHPTCQNCHDLEKQGREVNCRPCHREEILTLVPIWRDEIMRSRAELLSAIERLGTVKEKDIRTLIQETRLSVKKLKEDELIHNPRLASSEITSAYERIQSVYSAGGKEFKSKHLESLKLSSKSPCSPCHFGMETKRIRFGGKGFVHAPHIVDAEMECSDCHEETPELDRSHGDLTIEPSECETCH
ncbi:TPA: hypothetical protein EYP37_11680, partial [Candidatus Poribacteria bacterium]|nr:hypothetical protein [Candidatus Poribacteria bacterium]